MATEPGLERGGIDTLLERRLDAAPDDFIELSKQLVALQPEARQLAEIGMARPGLARMAPHQSLEFFAPRRSPAGRAVHSIAPGPTNAVQRQVGGSRISRRAPAGRRACARARDGRSRRGTKRAGRS